MQLAAPELRFFFSVSVLLKHGKARHRRIQRGVHGLMIQGTLALSGLEVHRTEAFDFLVEVDAGRIELPLDRVHPRRVDFLAHLGSLEIGLEGFADLVAVVDEVKNESVLLEGMGAVQPGKGLNGLDAGQSLVDVHRVQQGLIEARLVLLGNEQHLVLLGCEVLGQLLLPHAFVHLHLGVGRTGELVVLDDPRERHQRLDRIPLLLDVAVKALFVANCFEPRPGHDHRLGTSADFVTRGRVEMLDHDFRLLCDVVWMQVHEAGKRTGGLLAFHVRVVFTRLEKPVIRGVVRVVLQDVENEPLLDRLAHGVAVRGLAAAPEDLERLVFRRRRKGEKAQVGLPAPLGHAEE